MKSAALLLAAALLAGCAQRVVDFTAISTKNVNVPKVAQAPRVTGEDCAARFIFSASPNMETAIDRAIEAAGPGYDALVDGVVYFVDQSFILGRQCYRVEGTPIDTTAAAISQK